MKEHIDLDFGTLKKEAMVVVVLVPVVAMHKGK
jgi:hypothetical protein